jgi:hypothetical protein
MCTHVAAFGIPDTEAEAEAAAGFGDLFAPVAVDELQPAISAAPLQLSATTAR